MHGTENEDNYLIYQDNDLQGIQFLPKNAGNYEDFRAFSRLPETRVPYYRIESGIILPH